MFREILQTLQKIGRSEPAGATEKRRKPFKFMCMRYAMIAAIAAGANRVRVNRVKSNSQSVD